MHYPCHSYLVAPLSFLKVLYLSTFHRKCRDKSGVSHCITWHPELLPTVPLYASLGSSLMVWFLTWVAGQSSVNDLKVSAEMSMLLINTILTKIENGIYPKGSF
uniref:Uncharacterized protein n=1 Tax=Setaria viridis TaxID=4556 RepID=A0A4U6V3U3_SETVI|nr:hypothetical protein SEVIR_4G122400v2 [Setaria viridis]